MHYSRGKHEKWHIPQVKHKHSYLYSRKSKVLLSRTNLLVAGLGCIYLLMNGLDLKYQGQQKVQIPTSVRRRKYPARMKNYQFGVKHLDLQKYLQKYHIHIAVLGTTSFVLSFLCLPSLSVSKGELSSHLWPQNLGVDDVYCENKKIHSLMWNT